MNTVLFKGADLYVDGVEMCEEHTARLEKEFEQLSADDLVFEQLSADDLAVDLVDGCFAHARVTCLGCKIGDGSVASVTNTVKYCFVSSVTNTVKYCFVAQVTSNGRSFVDVPVPADKKGVG